MEWIILFLISWILFFLLVDWKTLKINIWCGIAAMGMQLFIDYQFISHKLYAINNKIFEIFGSSVFFVTGPVLVIGVLLAQYHPSKRWARIVHLIIMTGLFSLEEIFLIKRHAVDYINWHHIDSIGVNLAVIGLLSWFSIVILKKGRNSGK